MTQRAQSDQTFSPSTTTSVVPAIRQHSTFGLFARDLAAGTAAGIAQTVTGQPLDTLKVRMQAGSYGTTMDCVRALVQKEGMYGFYKGMSPPLVGVTILNATLFSVNGQIKKLFQRGDANHSLTVSEHVAAGALTGIFTALAINPYEILKCRLQVQTESGGAGPIEMMRRIYRAEGIRGFYYGTVSTWGREIPATAGYFGLYNGVKIALVPEGKTVDDLQTTDLLLAGAAAGIGFWTFGYPSDVVKSKLQTQDLQRPLYSGFMDCCRKIYAEKGIKGFFRGYGVSILRAAPVNAITFLVYEWTFKFVS